MNVILRFCLCPEPRVFVIKLVHKATLAGGVPAPKEKAVWDFAKGKYSDLPIQFLKDPFPGGWIGLPVCLAQPQLPDSGDSAREFSHESFEPDLAFRIELVYGLRELLIPLLK